MNTPATPLDSGRLAVTARDAARMLGISRAQLYRLHSSGRLHLLAASLGVSADSLSALQVGRSPGHAAHSFPMTNVEGRVVGIRLRSVGGPMASGKSRVFDVLARLVFRPLSPSNLTGPAP